MTRRAFALVELLVALTLLAVVLGAVVGLAAAQQRAHSAYSARRAARVQLRDAALVLARDLRPLVVAADGESSDLREASDTLLDVLATTGGSVACAVVGEWGLEVPPAEPADAALTWWVAVPREGDVALVLDAGADGGAGDDRWLGYVVAAAGASVGACAGSPLAGPVPGGYRLTLAGAAALPPTVTAGAPVAFARRRRWSHYRGSDGLWYLGVREWDGASWTETQPVAGPFRRAAGARGGMSVAVQDGAGGPVAPDAGALAAVRVVLRADPAVAWRAGRVTVAAESARVLAAARGLARGEP